MIKARLQKQIEFIKEIEKLKLVFRANKTLTPDKYENSAEHSWHIAIMAILFTEYSEEEIDLLKVTKMLLIHDLVEIDFGDNCIFSEKQVNKFENEKLCAERIFGLLPTNQKDELMNLWLEFEERETP